MSEIPPTPSESVHAHLAQGRALAASVPDLDSRGWPEADLATTLPPCADEPDCSPSPQP